MFSCIQLAYSVDNEVLDLISGMCKNVMVVSELCSKVLMTVAVWILMVVVRIGHRKKETIVGFHHHPSSILPSDKPVNWLPLSKTRKTSFLTIFFILCFKIHFYLIVMSLFTVNNSYSRTMFPGSATISILI